LPTCRSNIAHVSTYQQGLLTLQRKRTGGNQQVTVKHIHQQVNVTQGGQAVVAGDNLRTPEELDAAGSVSPASILSGADPNKREAANVRACRLAGAISRMSATYQQGLLTLQRKRTGGNQQVTVKHIHQQVNVTQGGQNSCVGAHGNCVRLV
jgi:hypothetical protein